MKNLERKASELLFPMLTCEMLGWEKKLEFFKTLNNVKDFNTEELKALLTIDIIKELVAYVLTSICSVEISHQEECLSAENYILIIFIFAGDFTGKIIIGLDSQFIISIANKMFGKQITKIDEADDIINEIVNFLSFRLTIEFSKTGRNLNILSNTTTIGSAQQTCLNAADNCTAYQTNQGSFFIATTLAR